MKKLFLASAAVIALAASPASGADVPRKPVYKAAPPIVAPLPFSWTGFYVGVNAGGGWAREDSTLVLGGNWNDPAFFALADKPAVEAGGSRGTHPSGFTGGGQVGFNWQVASPIVVGIEADINSLRLRANTNSGTVQGVATPNTYTVQTSFESDWIATVRGRLGFAFDRVLIFGTGGLAVANHKFAQMITQTCCGTDFTEGGSVSSTKTGWAVGGGLEYAIVYGWSIKGEYLYADLGKVSFASAGVCTFGCGFGGPTYTGTHEDKLRIQIARVGINYKFDWGKGKAPVVAKY
jgi:outer membrane immunogenic protein